MNGQGVRRARLTLITLENRVTPTVTAGLLNGVLTVLGDTGANNLAVNLSGGNLTVSATGQSFAASSVSTIVIDGGQGNDTITVGSGVTQQCWLFGGSGDDRIVCGSSAGSLLFGGNGNDYLQGGPGNDSLFGGAGTDTLADTQGSNILNQGGPNQTASLDSVSSAIVTQVNQQRAANGVAALSVSPILTFAAQSQSNQMAQQSIAQGVVEAMNHVLMGVALPTMSARMAYAGYDYTAIGENIAFGYSGADDVMQGWMNSPGHRANILDATYTEIGVSVKANPDGVLYFTQEFGKPMVPTGGSPPGGTTSGTPSGWTTMSPVASLVAVGAGAGMDPKVVLYDAVTGQQRQSFEAYATSFTGGVRVAVGDVNGDGFSDVITAPGPGMAPLVQVIDGKSGAILRSFNAYDAGFTGGIFVAAGDVNGDGKSDIVTGAGAGGGPHVRIFNGATGAVINEFFAYPAVFSGGVSVAAGDVDGDGKSDVVTGAGAGGGPLVRVFHDGTSTCTAMFYAYDPSFSGGVSVAAGDINGDGKSDIITGAGAGGGPHVQVFSGANLSVLKSFFAYSSTFNGGVCVSCADQDGDGRPDLLVSGGAGAANPAQAFSGLNLARIRNYSPFGSTFLGGCFVG